jgi:hypothetical protein
MHTINSSTTPSIYQRIILRPLGLDSENALVLWLLLIAALLFGGSLWISGGNIFVALGILLVAAVFGVSIFKPVYSFYIFILLVLISDQYLTSAFQPFTSDIHFFLNIKEISYLPTFNAGVFNPVEIFLLLLVVGLAVQRTFRKDFKFRPIPVWGAALFFFGTFLFSFLYGMSKGGDFLVSLWEIRALFYFFILYFLTPQLIRTRSELKGLVWVFIIGISFKAFQAVFRFISLGFTTGRLRTLTNHEDPVFMVTLLILLLGFLVYRAKNKQRVGLIILTLPLLLGFYAGERRAAYAGAIISIIVFIVILSAEKRRMFLKYAFPFFIGIIIYSGLFWTNQGTLGRPVQLVKSGIFDSKNETTKKNYESDLYRDDENYDLAQTAKRRPLIGIGFGNAFDEPIFLPRLAFPLQNYISHNQILWLIVKMGGIGFFAFWFFFNCYAARATHLLRRLNDPYLKAILIVTIVAAINQMVVSFYDLQLTYYRNMIYLGCLLGLLKTIEMLHVDANEHTEKVAEGDVEFAES